MKIATLFSGIGAPEQAAHRVYSNHEIVFACEWDKFARQSYEANYDIAPGHFHKDINDMDGTQYKNKVDILIGGSPCQDFSIAGLRKGIDGHRGQLIWQYYRIIKEVMPPVFIYENVKGMVSDKGGKTLKDFLQIFREAGYHCHYDVLNTKHYGVPQNRERIFIVGFLNHDHYHRFQFAPKTPLVKRLRDVLESDIDEKYYLSEKMIEGFATKEKRYQDENKNMGFCFKPLNAKDTCTTITARYFKCGASDPYIKEPKIVASRGRNPNNTSDRTPGNYVEQRLEVNENGTSNALTTVQKDNYVLEPRIFEHRTDGIRFFSDNCCGALRTKSECGDKRVIEDCHAIRKLTPRECLRLQDFSDDFKIVVSDSQMYKQAGNSMSVNVLEMIFKQIELAKSGETTNTLLDFVS